MNGAAAVDPAQVREQLEALSEIYRTSYRDFFRQAMAMVRSPELADDVIQEAVVFTAQTIRKGTVIREFKPWLRVVVRNCARSALSRRRARLATSAPLEEGLEIAGAQGTRGEARGRQGAQGLGRNRPGGNRSPTGPCPAGRDVHAMARGHPGSTSTSTASATPRRRRGSASLAAAGRRACYGPPPANVLLHVMLGSTSSVSGTPFWSFSVIVAVPAAESRPTEP